MQYNTCFWTLVKYGKSKAEAQQTLQVNLDRACEGHLVLGWSLQALWDCRECSVACMATPIKDCG